MSMKTHPPKPLSFPAPQWTATPVSSSGAVPQSAGPVEDAGRQGGEGDAVCRDVDPEAAGGRAAGVATGVRRVDLDLRHVHLHRQLDDDELVRGEAGDERVVVGVAAPACALRLIDGVDRAAAEAREVGSVEGSDGPSSRGRGEVASKGEVAHVRAGADRQRVENYGVV